MHLRSQLVTVGCDLKGRISATPAFHGQTRILKQMKDCFSLPAGLGVHRGQSRCVLHGLGGSGKTQVVYRFIEDAGDR
jgi:hypothetical protein